MQSTTEYLNESQPMRVLHSSVSYLVTRQGPLGWGCSARSLSALICLLQVSPAWGYKRLIPLHQLGPTPSHTFVSTNPYVRNQCICTAILMRAPIWILINWLTVVYSTLKGVKDKDFLEIYIKKWLKVSSQIYNIQQCSNPKDFKISELHLRHV